MNELKKYWMGLQPRERLILAVGACLVTLILLYALLFQPWHKALNHMESALPGLRSNLTWMRQQSEALKKLGGAVSTAAFKDSDQSLLSVVEQTARKAKLKKAIQQMTPASAGTEVRVVLEDANFNQWLRWIDELYKQYGVDIKQVSAERDEDRPNICLLYTSPSPRD